jgi:hypothetical protein
MARSTSALARTTVATERLIDSKNPLIPGRVSPEVIRRA